AGGSSSGSKKTAAASQNSSGTTTQADTSQLQKVVLPSSGVQLPITWGGLGKKLLDEGVIDRPKLEALYAQPGGLSKGDQTLLDGSEQKIIMTAENAPYLLNLLWAFGLANKNTILEQGPISDKQYGGAGGFASTGGWTLAKGEAMGHFSKHPFVKLTAEQQQRVENVSKNIYRPCCGNSTNFPDCNHGMAMLGLLELMAAQNVSEQEMYKVALQVNAYWFPDTYLTIASYLQSSGRSWASADPKELLGRDYSSSSGYKQIASRVTPAQGQGGSGCGV
ncbi:MAG: hypothetical protein HY566_02555, partial [Candidatus Kerfeldbacteria bacterium]|nr:hypothetical protein [Candidatus Kerfeldbacteria bacterium]